LRRKNPGLLIALSAGGDAKELSAQGLGMEHINEMMVRLSMKLLSDGHRLAYGGTLGTPSQPLMTQALINTAQNYLHQKMARVIDVTDSKTWPLINYSAWPHYKNILAEQRALLVGVCNFIDVDPEGVSPEMLKLASEKSVIERYKADALSAMREKSAVECDLRIVWGGKTEGASGWMPGVLEEVACSLRHHKPVLILGGFGGCARRLADYVGDYESKWPFGETVRSASESLDKERMADHMQEAWGLLRHWRKTNFSLLDRPNIPKELFVSALSEETPRKAIRIAAEAANHLKQALT
jgi:hypothetical protein